MLDLPPGEVHVWWAEPRLDDAWFALLDAPERERFDAYRRDQDRARFLTGTALVRHIYAADLGIDAAEVRLERRCGQCDRAHGKVKLATGQPSTIELSISHSGDWVLVAACREHAVGVDVERINPKLDHTDLARIALAEGEIDQLSKFSDAERPAAFTRYWTRKESVVKATGDGLRTPLADFAVSAPDEPARVLAWPTRPGLPARLQLHDLDSDTEHCAAVAILDATRLRVVRADVASLPSL